MIEPVPVSTKGLDILELLARSQDAMSAPQISAGIQLPKSTIHCLLKTIVPRGYVRQLDEQKRQFLGYTA